MKYKVIALAVSGALLAACGSDNDNYVEQQNFATVQAFDGAVRYLDTFITCGTETEQFVGETGGQGKILIGEGNFPLFDQNPSQCSFSFREDPNFTTKDAIDESNGKSMTNVVYEVPGALITPGQPIAGTPYSTLIAAKIEEAGDNPDIDAIINEAFVNTLPAGVTLDADLQALFLSDPQTALDSMDATVQKNVLASTMVLSDAIAAVFTAGSAPDVSLVESATQNAATDLASNPGFPTSEDGKPTYVELSDDFETYYEAVETDPSTPPPVAPTDPEDLTPGEELEPEDPTEVPPVEEELPPPTGGTGGTAG
ncbi:hypothetical protein [Vibrio breoganii]|uniref:hypothetical protein n=1 Tax=Vibrio breoganii TaxID=553239 RepID=UPI0010BD05F2|nr:hypothetical protein [Vibrio breoganii]TKG20034.1 hypothetical protein FCV81_11140 [Vibrio breoganii]